MAFLLYFARYGFSMLDLHPLVVVNKTFRYLNVFSTTTYALMPPVFISKHFYGKRYNFRLWIDN